MKPLALIVLHACRRGARRGAGGQPSHASVQAQVHGLILMNAFANTRSRQQQRRPAVRRSRRRRRVASRRARPAPRSASRASPPRALVPEFAGGQLTGELDVDFFGGQQPSTGGRTFPLLRLRRAFAELTRGRLDAVRRARKRRRSSRSIRPRSPASASPSSPAPAISGSGFRRSGSARDVANVGAVRLGLEVAVLAPTSGDAQTAFFTQPDIAERSSRPYLQGRMRARWGAARSRARSASAVTTAGSPWDPSRRVASRALAVSVWTPLGPRARAPRRGLHRTGAGRTGWRRDRSELRTATARR